MGCSPSVCKMVVLVDDINSRSHQHKQAPRARTSTQSSPNPRFTPTPAQIKQRELVISPRGVSLEFLGQLMDDVQKKKSVPGTNLVVLQRDITLKLKDGTTKILAAGHNAKVLSQDGKVYTLQVRYADENVKWATADWASKHREDWTIEDICEHVVMPATNEKNQSFFHQVIDQKHVGPKHKGLFVSQTRSTKFNLLFDALITWCVDEGLNPAECYVWLDVFSANQPLLTSGSADISDLLKYGLHDMIARFEYTVLVLDSWQKATALKRAWCLWELYGAVVNRNDGFTVVLPRFEMEKFEYVLRNEKGSIFKLLRDIDVSKAQCHDENDRKRIMEEVGNKVKEVNSAVKDEFSRSGQALLSRPRADAPNTTSMARSFNLLGSCYLKQGKYDEAEAMFKRALKIYMKGGGGCRAEVTTSLGHVYEAQGKYAKAESMFVDALRLYKLGTHAKNNPDVAMAQINLGLMHKMQGKYSMAEVMFVGALEIYKLVYGLNHYEVADTQKKLTVLYQVMKSKR